MKIPVLILLVVSLLLCTACQKMPPDSTDSTPDTTLEQTDTGSDLLIPPKPNMDTQYIPTDPERSAEYNLAVRAYNAFLAGKTTAVGLDGEPLSISRYGVPGSGTFRYALGDYAQDEVPYFLIHDTHYYVLTFDGENITERYVSSSWQPISLLENGAIWDCHKSVGCTYRYITLGTDGGFEEISFSRPPAGEPDAPYFFYSQQTGSSQVTQKQWETLTDPYFTLSYKPAYLSWKQYPSEGADPTPPASTDVNTLPFPQEVIQFNFASGAGAWNASLTLRADGNFVGYFHDIDMGDIGDGYPNGTVYTCSFWGKFDNIQKSNDYIYTMTLSEIYMEDEVGKEWIENGVRYVASIPVGIHGGKEFVLYLPDTPLDILTKEFLAWWPLRSAHAETPYETLSCYGILNVNTGDGFFKVLYPTEGSDPTPPASTDVNTLPFPQEVIQFNFASGAGAWNTSLTLRADGNFVGYFQDTDMGYNGDGYPNGTVFTCSFWGKFDNIQKSNDCIYTMTLSEIYMADEVGKEWIENGVRYVASNPAGIHGGKEFVLYLPDTPLDILTKEFLSWWPLRSAHAETPYETLSCYGILNVNTGEGFF